MSEAETLPKLQIPTVYLSGKRIILLCCKDELAIVSSGMQYLSKMPEAEEILSCVYKNIMFIAVACILMCLYVSVFASLSLLRIL